MTGQYEARLEHVLKNGAQKGDRTGTGTLSVFGHQMRFDLSEGFPLITTKKLYTKAIVGELIWMLRGDTNIGWLNDNDIHIWDEWADENGDLGPVYGAQWRSFLGSARETRGANVITYRHPVDQIRDVIEQIKTNPDSRRHIVSAWNPAEVSQQGLPPCHMMFQFYVVDGKLSCMLYQRSCDLFLGVPFNIASYALLTHIIAFHCGLKVGEFIWNGGDCHIYTNHIDQVTEQLSRSIPEFPILAIMTPRENVWEHEIDDFEFLRYYPHPSIKASVAV